jgi:hypothetical protein
MPICNIIIDDSEAWNYQNKIEQKWYMWKKNKNKIKISTLKQRDVFTDLEDQPSKLAF